MAQPTNMTVRYRRQYQPEQYGAEEVELYGAVELANGDEWEREAYELLRAARIQAHRLLGRPIPDVPLYVPTDTLEETATVEAKPAGKKGGGKKGGGKKAEALKAEPAPEPAVEDIEVMAEDPTPKAGADDADIDFDIDEPAAAEVIPDLADIQAEATKKARELGGPKEVQAVMKEYGVLRIGELKPEQRAPFLAAIKALTKG